ncbi:putative zinc protease [bacterium HR19]|nr:putative zinc protease [bacterium HR19]
MRNFQIIIRISLVSLFFILFFSSNQKLSHSITIKLKEGKDMKTQKAVKKEKKQEKTSEENVLHIWRFDIRKFRLKNGLDVILIPKRDGSRVSGVYLWVKSGAADEPSDFFGGAHVLEHIVFKGSPERGVSEVADSVEKAGGYINAWTSYDNTVYWAIIPSEKINVPLEVFSDIVFNPSFSKDEFEREKEVVLEEWRRGRDIPSSRLFDEFFQKIYKNHPYGHPVIGYEETIKSLTEKQVLNFYSRLYHPENIFLIVAGDFDIDHVEKNIRDIFGKIKGKESFNMPDESVKNPDFRGPESFVISGKEKEAILLMGFLGYDFSLTTSAYLDILAEILEKRLYERTRIKEMLANSVEVDYWSPVKIGLFLISFEANAENLEKIYNISVEEINKIKTSGISSSELETIKNLVISSVYKRFQDVRGIASAFGSFYQLTGDYNSVYEFVQVILSATKDDVENLARQILSEDRLLAGIYVNEQDLGYAEKVSSAVKSLALAKKSDLPFRLSDSKDGIEKYVSKNGVRVLLKKIQGTGTITISAVLPGGQVFYPEKIGIPLIVAESLTRGTQNRTAKMILDEVEQIGGSIGASVSFDAFRVSSSFLSSKRDKGFEIFFDVLLNPSFPDEEIQKVKQDILEDLRTRYDNPQVQAFDELYRTIFEGTPYAFRELAKEDVVKNAERKELYEFLDLMFSDPEKIVIAVVGDFQDSSEILKSLYLYAEKLFLLQKKKNISFPEYSVCKDSQEVKYVKREGNQVHIVSVFCGPSILDRDSIPLRVAVASVSGMGGRLFMNLREKRGLGYAVGPVREAFLAAGFFGGYIASAPEKLDASLEGLKSELQSLPSITDEEIERGKNILLGALRRSLQTNSDWAYEISASEFFGLGFNFYKKFQDEVKSISPDQVRNTLMKYTKDKPVITIVVGPYNEKR